MANNTVCRGRQTAFLPRLKPGVSCLFLMNQVRKDAVDYYMRAAGRRPGAAITVGVCRHVQAKQAQPANATLDLFGC